MSTPTLRYERLAQQLPPILKTFFKRYPPTLARPTTAPAPPGSATATSPTPSTDPSTSPPSASAAAAATAHRAAPDWDPSPPSPFAVWQHPITGRWQEPVYSLRRQAALVKAARAHGVEALLPPTAKAAGARAARRFEQGLRVRGTGVGQRVKGHWDERTLQQRLERRRQAMLRMPELVQKWREAGRGRLWKNKVAKASFLS